MADRGNESPEWLCERAERKLAERSFSEAAGLFSRALRLDGGLVRAHIGLGRALNNARRIEESEAAFRTAVQLAPGDAAAHNYLGHVLRAQGRAAEAGQAFRRAIDAAPDFAAAYFNLGSVLAVERQYDAAIAALEQGLALSADNLRALANLAELYQFADRHADAARALQRLAALEPGNPTHASALGDFYYSLGEIERARVWYDAALAIDARDPDAVAGRALLDEIWGDHDAGWRLVEPWLDLPRRPPQISYAAARLLRRQGRLGEARALLEALTGSDWRSDPKVWFALGEVLDEQECWDDAFDVFARANALKPQLFDAAGHDAFVQSLIGFFDRSRLARLPRAVTSGPRPVFIVGMPRSGTTLVEQVLASHPRVHAGGERFELPAIVAGLSAAPPGYPAALDGVDAGQMRDLSDRYLAGYGALAESADVFTDKLPKNFLNLGLIALMFPDARVVALRRDPRDVGLSVFFQNLNVRTDPWASRLDTIAAYSRAHDRLMDHWREVLPLPIKTLDYESLIDDFENQVRGLLEFAGLDWTPRCLEFHRTNRLVNTASYAQVRQPLYRSSMQRWRRYEAHLGPLADLTGG